MCQDSHNVIDFQHFFATICKQHMAAILSDRQIRQLLGDVIIGADERFISPNGIELRLGAEIRFLSTNEKKKIPPGHFINVHPGELVLITSVEKLDFRRETVNKHFEGQMLMAIITPTTTMMREGILQCATKVHAGYLGELTWGFRNSSSKDFIIQQGEPMFNLTLFLLEKDEVPDVAYGEKPEHSYQNTSGIAVSRRKVPSDIPKEELVESSFHKLDPKIQLREAGHPFSYIGKELTELEGQFELVSTGVDLLGKKIDGMKDDLTDKVDSLFLKRFIWAVIAFAGIISALYGLLGFLKQTSLSNGFIYLSAVFVGLGIPAFWWFVIVRKGKPEKLK